MTHFLSSHVMYPSRIRPNSNLTSDKNEGSKPCINMRKTHTPREQSAYSLVNELLTIGLMVGPVDYSSSQFMIPKSELLTKAGTACWHSQRLTWNNLCYYLRVQFTRVSYRVRSWPQLRGWCENFLASQIKLIIALITISAIKHSHTADLHACEFA